MLCGSRSRNNMYRWTISSVALGRAFLGAAFGVVSTAALAFSSGEFQVPISSTRILFEKLPVWNGQGERPSDGKHVYRDPNTSELVILVPAHPGENRQDKVYRYHPPNQVAPIISTSVTREGSTYTYEYRVRNGKEAHTSIGMWGVVGPGPETDLQMQHPKWRSTRSEKTVAKDRFSALPDTGEFLIWFGDPADRVAPNDEPSAPFAIRANARPGIATVYAGAMSALKVETGLTGAVAAELTPFMNWDAETVVVPVIGPRYRPDVPLPVIAKDYLAGMEKLVAVGWLSNQSRFYRALSDLLEQCSRGESVPSGMIHSVPVPGNRFEQDLAKAVLFAIQ